MKIRQQKELSETIVAKIQKELENPKVLQQILQQSVADVESKESFIGFNVAFIDSVYRDCFIEGTIDAERGSAQYRFPLSPLLSIKLPLCNSRKHFPTSASPPVLTQFIFRRDIVSSVDINNRFRKFCLGFLTL